MRVALGGPMGVGKSTVGRALAARLGAEFVDLDGDLGDIPGWFARGDEAGFRDAESAALGMRVRGAGVLALGGGTLVRAVNRALLREWYVVILMANEETIANRIHTGPARPLAADWRRLLGERRPIWEEFGTPIWTDGLDSAQIVDNVLARCSGSPSR